MHTPQRGFTLIEVMIVIAILAIVTAFAIPSYQNYIIKASREEIRAELLLQINKEQQRYALNGKNTPFDMNYRFDVGDPPRWRIRQLQGDFTSAGAITGFSAQSINKPGTTSYYDTYDPECITIQISLNLEKTATDASQKQTDKCW
jgi:prepilin-type N-terminal cleavage/methylation domain-containing protein